MQYVVGHYKTEEEANEACNVLTDKGPDDFIFCPLCGKRCNQDCPSIVKPYVIIYTAGVYHVWGWGCANRVVSERYDDPGRMR